MADSWRGLKMSTLDRNEISRRRFLEGTSVALIAAAETPLANAQNEANAAVPRTTIRLTVNGKAQRVEVEDRWTLVGAVARSPGAHRHQDRLRSRRMRRLHGAAWMASRCIRAASWRCGWMGDRIQTVEGLVAEATSSIRCSNPSWITTRRSAVSVPPAS